MLLNRFLLTLFTCVALLTAACKKEKSNTNTDKPEFAYRLKFINSTEEYSVDPSGTIKVMIYGSTVFEYDNKGYVSRVTTTDSADKLASSYQSMKSVATYVRDAANKVTKADYTIDYYGKYNNSKGYDEYIYGPSNELIKVNSYFEGLHKGSISYVWTGNRLTSVQHSYNGTKYDLTYNSSGDVIDITSWLVVNQGADTVKYINKTDISYDNSLNPYRTVYGLPFPYGEASEPHSFSQHNVLRYAHESGSGLVYTNISPEYNEEGYISKYQGVTYVYEKAAQ